jgi:hypothetical protein
MASHLGATPGHHDPHADPGRSSSPSNPSWVNTAGALQTQEDDPGASEEGWEITVRPYVWIPTISGSLTISGTKTKLTISKGTLIDDLRFAGMVWVEGVKDDTFIMLDALGFTITDEFGISGVPGGKLDVRVEYALAELYGGVRLLDDGEQTVDVFTGLRYVYLKSKVNPKGVGVGAGGSESTDWVDPIIGTRYGRDLSENWGMMLRADYGGFGVGSASDHSYGFSAIAEYAATERLQYGAGWRYLAYKRSSGSGTSKNGETLRFSGPIVGLSYRF